MQEIFDSSCDKEYAPLFCSLINHEAITLKDLKEDILVLAVRSGSPEIVEAVINKVGDLSNFKPKQAFGLALEKFQKQDSKESDKEILEKIYCSPIILKKSKRVIY